MEHEGESCPDVGIISDAEKGILQKKKKNTKNALTKSDLDKLSDNEIKLLPLKDFWDVKNKKWKKGDAGNIGKQKKARKCRAFSVQRTLNNISEF